MKRIIGIAVMVSMLLLMCTSAYALEVYPQELKDGTPFEVKVEEPVNPALVGYFKNADGEKWNFAYALVEREGKYVLYIKVDTKFNGWVGATLEGDVIYFGKGGKGQIHYTDEGIFRTFKGKAKTRLVKIN